jgi:hypothetical protein
VLLHELVHLLHAGHGPEFWAELETYPRTQRARGFLEGYAYREERGDGEPDGDEAQDEDRDDDAMPDDEMPDVEPDVENGTSRGDV